MSSSQTTPSDVPPVPPPHAAPTAVIPPAVYAVVPPKEPKSPLLALVLAILFPAGGGQLYNGQISKAFAFFGAFVGTIYLTAEVDPMPFAFFIPFIYFYSLIDSWRSATIINARAAGRPAQPEAEDDSDSPAWGLVLVGVGLVLLMNNLGLLELLALRRFWPVLLIAIGLVFLRRALARRDAAGLADAEPRRDETL